MQRRTILLVGLLFCAVAAGAGYIVASASSAGSGVASTLDTLPTNVANSAPTLAATAEPTPPPTAEPTAAPAPEPAAEPTAAPAAEPTAEPTAAPAPEPTSAPAAPPTEEFIEYTVQRGDLLLAIANQYGVTVKEILAVNQIENPDSLRVGQVLRIPKK